MSYTAAAHLLFLTFHDPTVYSLSDCAVCADGYGRGVGNTCHSCNDANTPLLYVADTLLLVVMLLLLAISVVFLIGGLDAIDTVHQSLTRTFSEQGPGTDLRDAFALPVADFVSVRKTSKIGPKANSKSKRLVPKIAPTLEVEPCDANDRAKKPPSRSASDSDHPGGIYRTPTGPLGAVNGIGIELSDVPVASNGSPDMNDEPAPRGSRQLPAAGIAVGGPYAGRDVDVGSTRRATSKCCGFSKKAKHWISILPLDKLKVLVVVWQIIAVSSSITGVEFPDSYARFLSWITVVNLDIGSILSALCVLPSVNFYVRLLVSTLSPLVLAAVLVLTYHLAKIKAGIGSAGVIARRSAWSRHVAAGLLLTFLVGCFGSLTSSIVASGCACRCIYVYGRRTASLRLMTPLTSSCGRLI